MANTGWTAQDIPNLAGKRAIVTGGNSGIGFYAALELARHGAEVILTSRDAAKGKAAKARILGTVIAAKVTVVALDLASLASVRAFAAAQTQPFDLLINNAGVMAPPRRRETVDGMELQFGTNVVGHFALTALLYPLLNPEARVVWIASIAHKHGKIDFDDLQTQKKYSPMGSYQQSKLADLMLAFEMDRRLRLAGSTIRSVAAHPGVANTNLFEAHKYSWLETKIRRGVMVVVGKVLNTQAGGALPTLYAAVAPEAAGGGYYGPQGFQEMRGGDVGPAQVAPQARDEAVAKRLWQVCEQLGGASLL